MSISRARKRSLSPDIHDQRPMKRSQLQRRTVKSKSSKQNELYDAPKLKGMSPAAMREMLLRRVQRFSPELSEVELADQVIPGMRALSIVHRLQWFAQRPDYSY